MQTATRTGRIIGALLLLQVAAGILTNFVLTAPLFGEPGFLVNAAPHARQIGLSALLGIGMGLVSLGIASLLYPLFRQRSQPMALFYFAVVGAGFALTVVENMQVMSLLSLSQAYAKSGAGQEALFEGLRLVVKESRNWSHYLGLVVSGCTLFTLYAGFFRCALVPRWLAIVGMAASLSQMVAVSMPIFGSAVDFRLIMPLGLCQIVLALWLLVRGFRAGP